MALAGGGLRPMAKKNLGSASLEVVRAVTAAWPGDAVVGVSGGADSLALALGAEWTAKRRGDSLLAVIVDHQLQPGSADVAARTAELCERRGIPAEVRVVDVEQGESGIEAAARDARLAALASYGRPVLLGHTLDDQAEQVFLGLLRGSGTRSLAGIPTERGLLRRPLLGVRRETTLRACEEWGVEIWHDPMNDDPRFARVRIRRWLAELSEAMGRDAAEALARSARLARADADLLDELAECALGPQSSPPVAELASLDDAIRWRVLKAWLQETGAAATMQHVLAVDELVTGWRGQGPIDVPGGKVVRREGALHLLRPPS